MTKQEEFLEYQSKLIKGEDVDGYKFSGIQDDIPDNFANWIKNNTDRIKRAKTMPYFIRDNEKIVDEIMNKKSNEFAVLEKALGISCGEPMSFEQANKMRGNPNYAEDVQYRVNCQSAVVANELRRRGWDVEAFGNTKLKNTTPYAISKRTECAWLDKNGNIPSPTIIKRIEKSRERYVDKNGYVRNKIVLESDKELIQRFYEAIPDEGRYHICWTWKKKKTGHILTAERLSDGNIRFYDPQNGKITSIKLNDIDLQRGFKILRVDNLQPNVDVVRGVVKKAGSNAATPLMDDIQKAFWKKNGADSNIVMDAYGIYRKKSDIIKDPERFAISEQYSVKSLKTGLLRCDSKSRRFFINHCRNENELDAAEYIWNNPQKLQYINKSPMGEGKDMTSVSVQKNIESKKSRGVEYYNKYSFEYKGQVWFVKTEVLRGGRSFIVLQKNNPSQSDAHLRADVSKYVIQ